VTGLREHHATLFLPAAAAAAIEAVRREWDPAMAAQIAAHVTLVYPQEAPQADLLAERLRFACVSAAPFRLRLGAIACWERPEEGVYVEVDDVDGGYRRLREALLRPPFQAVAFTPHVTLIHPRTSDRGGDFWACAEPPPSGADFAVSAVAITAFDGARCHVTETFRLSR
jgi:2'-5' RNA ligase